MPRDKPAAPARAQTRQARLRGEGDRFVVTIGDGYRDGSAGIVGLSAADRSAARPALESRHPARAHPPGAVQGLRSLRTRSTEIPQAPVRYAMAVTVSQLGPVLNPHGPDLRK